MEQSKEEVAQSHPPSHILQDGRFVHLPPPTDRDRAIALERAIAKNGWLQKDLAEKIQGEEKEEEKATEDTKEEPKVHPLALASARLQANGINELNRAINLSSLVGEYLGLSNIVDKPATDAEDQRTKAQAKLHRKRTQFTRAKTVLDRQQRRLTEAIVAQAQPDRRWRQLRSSWKMVAPEHGTRAKPHATRPTETIACDVDIYRTSALGRLARHVPRYATLEIPHEFDLKQAVQSWERRYLDDDAMDEEEQPPAVRAEPFALPDPTLGKLDVDFDPTQVPLLTLQFDIEKTSTGFCQSATIEPTDVSSEDEQVFAALQHSLFCAKLFESIRRELAPDTEEVGHLRTSAQAQSVVWLASDSTENFLPPPSMMAKGDGDLHPMAVIHCHEGEVMVQLDVEYNLRVKLVEASEVKARQEVDGETKETGSSSGTQSPQRLRILCRSLLYHAHDTFHYHSKKLSNEENGEESKTPIARKKEIPSPRILQRCVSLGAKMLLETRIRTVLQDVQMWLTSQTTQSLQVEWLPLSIFDLHSHFTMAFGAYLGDVVLASDELTVTAFVDGSYHKAQFRSDRQFESYLRTTLRRHMQST